MRLFLSLFLLISFNADAAIDAYPFPNSELRDRHNVLIAELRCPQCLNTNLAGSDSMIAKDLRREVHRLLLEGKSDEEILEFMYQRYGDFILYKPRLQGGTFVLWFGPLLLLFIALVILVRVLMTRKKQNLVMDESETDRLQKLIGKS
jgi:cytochrome c-type biogenesis protein CcmH